MKKIKVFSLIEKRRLFFTMKLNTKLLLKTVSLLSLTTPLVYAGDCTELEEYYKNKDILYISNCEENDNGKIIKLYIFYFPFIYIYMNITSESF